MGIKKDGFFSVELAVCIAVSMILLVVAAYKGGEFFNNGRTAKASTETANFSAVISQYKFEVGKYPTQLDDLTKTVGQYGPWIKKIPKDPWNHAYQYQLNDTSFAVWSNGKDGASNGSSITGIKNDDIGFIGK